jgi:hypothetical protein
VEFINNGKSLIKRFDKKGLRTNTFFPTVVKTATISHLKELLVGHNTIPRSQTTEKGSSSDRNLGGKLYLS